MILTINGGSSSIKFALYETALLLEKTVSGELSGIGTSHANLVINKVKQTLIIPVSDYPSAIICLLGWLKESNSATTVTAIGHRVVHGMKRTEPCLVTREILAELKQIIPYDPDHLPSEIKLIEAFQKHFTGIRQYACFDAAFHQTMPLVAKLLPIPRRFEKQGIRKYGFHGLSYQYLVKELENVAGKKIAHGKVVLAHLGSGASLAAVFKGKSIDTSMGFTPAGGIPMSSRSGDLDPGVSWIMLKTEKLSPGQFNHLINHESGLLGISETSGDMATLLAQEADDNRSAEAIGLFCYHVKKWIGAFTAALGGIDTLVLSGGIGENSPLIRTRICDGLGFLGIELDEKRNADNSLIISKDKSRVPVYVIPTDEESMIAQLVNKMIDS